MWETRDGCNASRTIIRYTTTGYKKMYSIPLRVCISFFFFESRPATQRTALLAGITTASVKSSPNDFSFHLLLEGLPK